MNKRKFTDILRSYEVDLIETHLFEVFINQNLNGDLEHKLGTQQFKFCITAFHGSQQKAWISSPSFPPESHPYHKGHQLRPLQVSSVSPKS